MRPELIVLGLVVLFIFAWPDLLDWFRSWK